MKNDIKNENDEYKWDLLIGVIKEHPEIMSEIRKNNPHINDEI